MRTIPTKIISTLLGAFLLATSNSMWAQEQEPDPIGAVVPQACQDVRDNYPSLKSEINQSCVSVREALTQAQEACNGFWRSYCLTPCDQTPPSTGGPKDADGQAAWANLCAAKQALQDCKEQRAADREALKQWASGICCPLWPCFCPSVVGDWTIRIDWFCDGSTALTSLTFNADHTGIGSGFVPLVWTQNSCDVQFGHPSGSFTYTGNLTTDGTHLSGTMVNTIGGSGCWTADRVGSGAEIPSNNDETRDIAGNEL